MDSNKWDEIVAAKIKGGLSEEGQKSLLRLLSREFDDPEDDYEALWEDIFGKRSECPHCGHWILPSFTCLSCEDWVAPRVSPEEQRTVIEHTSEYFQED